MTLKKSYISLNSIYLYNIQVYLLKLNTDKIRSNNKYFNY